MTVDAPLTTHRLPGGPLRDHLLEQIRAVLARNGAVPRLVIVQVGDDERSSAYIRHKLKAAASVGMAAEVRQLPATAQENDLHDLLRQLGGDPSVDAIIAQTPLPAGWNVQAALDLVPPLKDCDGLGSANRQKLIDGDPTAIIAATPLGVLRLLSHPTFGAGLAVAGRTVAVIGNGLAAGRPLRLLLQKQGATVIGIDRDTPEPAAKCREASIVCAAVGVAHLVTRDWLQVGAMVVDIGLTRREINHKNRLLGDVAPEVQGVAGTLTPVPGGVGPMTVGSLLTNVVDGWLLGQGEKRIAWE